jgi:SagB-type dehydrogenase family enzyme
LGDGISRGKYHYCFLEQCLELVDPKIDTDALDRAFSQAFSLRLAFTVVLTAVVERSYRKYRERSYRFALLEAGHVAQNVCLAAAPAGLSAAPLGGFRDGLLAQELHLRTALEVPIYAVALG